jgi:acetyl esterase
MNPSEHTDSSATASAPILVRDDSIEIEGQKLAPEIQGILAAVARTGSPPLESLSVDRARAVFRSKWLAASGPPSPVGSVSNLSLDGATGSLPARLYSPTAGNDTRPVLVYFHGGGYVVGDLDTHDGVCRTLCLAGIRVLSVDYRLAPEHPFPAAVEDAHAALGWSLGNPQQLGATADAIAVGGDSAGATLATVATWLTVREGSPPPALQVLLYPGADQARRYRSHELFGRGFGLQASELDWFNNLYAPGRPRTDPRISPLRADDLSCMPPTIIAAAGFDPLRDEAEAYAEALHGCGSDIYLLRFSELIHGFANLIGISPASRRAVDEVAQLTRSLLEPAG